MGLADTIPGMGQNQAHVSAVKRLMVDHRAIRPLLSRAFANPTAQTKEQATRLIALLEPHAKFEDIVFQRLLPDKWTQHVLGEHEPILKNLVRAQEGDAQALKYAADLTLGHFDEEEAFVFPKLGGAS